jgi:hypothetical protein
MNESGDQFMAMFVGGSPFSVEFPKAKRPVELFDCNKILLRK